MVSHKKMDDLGRVVIPKFIRKEANIKEGEVLDVSFDGKCIKIQRNSNNYLHDCIRKIRDTAADSYDVTSSEYDELMRILEKLK